MEASLEHGIQERLAAVTTAISAACKQAGRNPEEVRLLAVSKFNPAPLVEAAWAAGQRLFGENRVQEAAEKFPLACGGSEVHLLGHLQSNKAKKAVALFDCIQSVDSIAILQEIDKQAGRLGKTMDVLLELHTGEESKSGFGDESALFAAAETALSLEHVRLRGLMTMAPFTQDQDLIRRSFVSCRIAMEKIRDRLRPSAFQVLSMGMSNDYPLAIAEGATLLRIGTAIFGSRG